MKDFYYILGTERDCTPQELTTAYRKLAYKLQPPGQEQDDFLDSHFNEVSEAFQVLSDPVRRRKYDMAYKKHYQRRLYYFKLKHLNIAVTFSLILLTGLFGMYVYKSLYGGKKKSVPQPASILAPVKVKTHHKKRHATTLNKSKSTHSDTTKRVAFKPAIPAVVNSQHAAVATVKSVSPSVPKPLPEVIAQAPPVQHIEKAPPADNTYTAYLKANTTGVVSLHEKASYRSAVLVNIPDKTKVQVLEKGTGFYKVNYNGQVGYVPKWTVGEW